MKNVKQKRLQRAVSSLSKEDAAKGLMMSYRIEQAARRTMYVAIVVGSLAVLASIYGIVFPVRLAWRGDKVSAVRPEIRLLLWESAQPTVSVAGLPSSTCIRINNLSL